MSNLLYDSTLDTPMSRLALRDIPTPPPMGSRHLPYSFADFTDNTVAAIENEGYEITDEQFAVQKDGQRMFGIIKVSNKPVALPSVPGQKAIYTPKWNLIVGVRGSHDQSIARGLVVGSQVMVCSNLCFSGDLGKWSRKQTTNIAGDIGGIIRGAVSQLEIKNRELTIDYDQFNRIQISKDDGDRILLDILRDDKETLSASQLERAIHHWDKLPDGYSYDSKGRARVNPATGEVLFDRAQDVTEHGANGRNLWWLFNACTHALKPTGANNNHSDKADQSARIYGHLQRAVENYQRLGRVYVERDSAPRLLN